MGAAAQGADADAGRWMTIPRSLCFITHNGDVLLMKRGENRRIFPGRYNGVGGHVERDEDLHASVLREVQEETGLSVINLRLRGICHVDAGQEVGIMVFVFSAEATTREVIVTSEGSLHWVPLVSAHNLPLVEDVPILLSRMFGPAASDTLFFAHTSYDAQDQLVMTFAPE